MEKSISIAIFRVIRVFSGGPTAELTPLMLFPPLPTPTPTMLSPHWYKITPAYPLTDYKSIVHQRAGYISNDNTII